MKFLQKAIITLLLFSISFSVVSQKKPINSSNIKKRIKNETLTYKMSKDGDSLGYTIAKYSIENANLIIAEDVLVNLNGANFKETNNVIYDLKKSKVSSNNLKMEYGSNKFSFSGKWNDKNHIQAKVNNSIDTLITNKQEHIVRFLSLFLLPRLIHDANKNVSYTQFSPNDLKFRSVKASPKGKTYLNTSYGKIDCNILKLEGGMASQTMYIDTKTNRIVKIEIPAQGWVYELVKVQLKD